MTGRSSRAPKAADRPGHGPQWKRGVGANRQSPQVAIGGLAESDVIDVLGDVAPIAE